MVADELDNGIRLYSILGIPLGMPLKGQRAMHMHGEAGYGHGAGCPELQKKRALMPKRNH